MGLDQAVTFAPGKVPAYCGVSEMLAQRGFPAQMRMIDGNLAFPNEMPEETWHELRLATPQGMVTIRREGERIVCVTWGNADAALLQAWNAVTWAFAAVGDGRIAGAEGSKSAAEFHQTADLPPALR
jgi:hypothetical protein